MIFFINFNLPPLLVHSLLLFSFLLFNFLLFNFLLELLPLSFLRLDLVDSISITMIGCTDQDKTISFATNCCRCKLRPFRKLFSPFAVVLFAVFTATSMHYARRDFGAANSSSHIDLGGIFYG